MLALMNTLEAPPSARCPQPECGGSLLCLGNEHEGWRLGCMRCGEIAIEEMPPTEGK